MPEWYKGNVRQQSTSSSPLLAATLHHSWYKYLKDEFSAPYFTNLASKLYEERRQFNIYPPDSLVFSWSHFTPFESVRVVILGQDPYPVKGQATGLAFSLSSSYEGPISHSLQNIFKEVEACTGSKLDFSDGSLEKWALQGVLLLNSILTVRENSPTSHAKIGWEQFTDRIIEMVLRFSARPLAFLLWGQYAQKKLSLILKKSKEIEVSSDRHLILISAHPASFRAHRDFLGNGHFSQVNQFLRAHGETPIDWSRQ